MRGKPPEKFKFFRFCLGCDKRFKPTKFQKFCNECIERKRYSKKSKSN